MKERDLHITVVALLDVYAKPDLLWHHPANGENRNIVTAVRLKKMGVRAGTPDLCLTLPNGRSAFMEFKGSKGRLSPAQIVFRDNCHKIGAPYALVTDPDDAMTILAEWGALLPVAWRAHQPRGQRNEPSVDAALRRGLSR